MLMVFGRGCFQGWRPRIIGGECPKEVKANIDKIKSLTSKPLASTSCLVSFFVEDVILIEEGVLR